MNSTPTANFWLDTRRANKEGLYPVKLSITYERKTKRYSTKNILPLDLQYLSEGDFLASYRSTPNSESKLGATLRKKIRNLYITKLENISNQIQELDGFSFQMFEEQVLNRKEFERNDIIQIGLDKIESFNEGQITSKMHYKMALNSLGRFRFSSDYDIFGDSKDKFIHKEIPYEELTTPYMKRYVDSLKARGLATATIGIHLRCLRHLFNIAKNKKIIETDAYPFGKGKVEISNGKSEKHILSTSQLKQLIDVETYTDEESFAKDMFLLSFLCYGMNITDLLHLEESNFIGSNFFRFFRRKTSGKENRSIKVYLVPLAKEILERLRIENGKYILPALNDKTDFKYDTPERVKAKTEWIVKRINRGMKSICERLEVEKVTTYDARYSFANLAKNNAVPYNFIQECMGHSKGTSITEVYLEGFDDDKIIEYTNVIFKDLLDE